MDNYNYPLGSDTKDAPWNEPAPPKERKFKCHVAVTLERDVDVPTQGYNESIEEDEDGKYLSIDTDDVDWREEYDNNCITITEMLNELKAYVEQDLAMTGKNTGKGIYLQKVLEACQGWEVTETYVEEA